MQSHSHRALYGTLDQFLSLELSPQSKRLQSTASVDLSHSQPKKSLRSRISHVQRRRSHTEVIRWPLYSEVTETPKPNPYRLITAQVKTRRESPPRLIVGASQSLKSKHQLLRAIFRCDHTTPQSTLSLVEQSMHRVYKGASQMTVQHFMGFQESRLVPVPERSTSIKSSQIPETARKSSKSRKTARDMIILASRNIWLSKRSLKAPINQEVSPTEDFQIQAKRRRSSIKERLGFESNNESLN